MFKAKYHIFLILILLFLVNFLQANDYISFNGRYTNVILSSEDILWKTKNKLTFENVRKEIKTQPNNPDVWYIGGYYWQYIVQNRLKAEEYYKKSMELAPSLFRPNRAYVDIICRKDGAEKLFSDITNLFFKIKNSNNTIRAAWTINYFKSEDINQLNRLFNFIVKNKNKIPDYRYPLATCALKAGNRKSALELYEQELAITKNNNIKENILNELDYNCNDEPELQVIRNRILDKYLSPYKRAIQKIHDVKNDPELYVQTTNAFAVAQTQWQKIFALDKLAHYGKMSYREEIMTLVTNITEEKVTSYSGASWMGQYLLTLGETNLLYSYLFKAIDAIPTNKGKYAAQIVDWVYHTYMPLQVTESNKYILKKMTNRFKDDKRVVNSVADMYQKYNFSGDELKCRKLLLKISNDKNVLNKAKARIMAIETLSGKKANSKKFINENINNAKNNAAIANTLSLLYFSDGKSNDALKVLLDCVKNENFPSERALAASSILKTDWGDLNKNALSSLFAVITNDKTNVRHIFGKIFWKYIDIGLTNEATDVLVFGFKKDEYPNKFLGAIKLFDTKILVNKIIAEKISNDEVLLSIIRNLDRWNKSPYVYKLRKYYLNLPNKYSKKYYIATQMLEYDYRNYNTNLCFDTVEKIDNLINQKIIPERLPANLDYYMTELGLSKKCDLWMDTITKNINKKYAIANINSFANYFLKNGQTNKFRNFISNIYSTNLPLRHLAKFLDAFNRLGDTNQYKSCLEIFGMSLTNIYLVKNYSHTYIDGLNILSRKNGENYDDEIDKFIRKWIDAKKLDLSARFRLFKFANTNIDKYAEMFLKNKNKLKDWQLMNIISALKRHNYTNDLTGLYNYVLNSPGMNSSYKVQTAKYLMRDYIDNGDIGKATNCIEKVYLYSSAREKTNSYFLIQMGMLYEKVFNYDISFGYYTNAINKAKNIQEVLNSVFKIADAWKYNSVIDYARLSEINFSNKNNRLNKITEAFFLCLSGKTLDGRNIILKIEKQFKTNKEKYSLWKAWKRVAEYNNIAYEKIFADKKMLILTDDINQVRNLTYEINYLLKRNEDYQKMLDFNTILLNVYTNKNIHDIIVLNICYADIGLGKTNKAWNTILQSDNIRDWGRIAFSVGKEIELKRILIKNIDTATSNKFIDIYYLISHYFYDKYLYSKLSVALDKNANSISPKYYVELSLIYLKAGEKEKARNLLKKYIDKLNPEDRPAARKLIDKYLDLKWRESLKYRGYIPKKDNLERFWYNINHN